MNVKTYTVTDVAKKGISALIRSAKEDGYVIVSKNGEPSIMVLPLGASGMSKFLDKMSSFILEDKNAPGELSEILALYKKLFKDLPSAT